MMDLPLQLTMTRAMPLSLPSGGLISLPVATPTIPLWCGAAVDFTFGAKPVLNFEGSPVFAELWILRTLQREGWQGAWVSSYPRIRYFDQMPLSDLSNVTALPANKLEVVEAIQCRAGKRGGCFDVMAWKHEQLIFCEAKRSKRDHIRNSQKRWIEAALAHGVPAKSLIIVEWSPA